MSKRFPLLLGFFLLLLCGFAGRGEAHADYRVMVASDLHYIAPALTDHGPFFTELTENADGKLMRCIEEITDAFLSEAEEEHPDALLLTGDLSFNGALLSHSALAEKLRRLEGKGVPVLVLPGNHDLDNPSAAAYSGDGYSLVKSASPEEFRRIYRDFGYDGAVSGDTDSLSYVWPLNETTRILMLDFNTGHHPCGLSDTTLSWIRGQLEDAKEAGLSILAAGHQNLFQQTIFRGGYVIDRAEELAALFREYGVPLYLSGHLHCQHRMTVEGLTEIAGSALSVTPCQYGVLTEEGGKLRYEARVTDVAAWAKRQGLTEPRLTDFDAWAADFFDRRTQRQAAEILSLFSFTGEEIAQMADYMAALNRAYFSGDLKSAAALDPDGSLSALWSRYPTLYSAYLESVSADLGEDFRFWESE
jgi:Predicted phosphohydrolases